ncbi:MAG: ABC transporter permease subunit [Firmicutes bacterium]|nr:ABC transporter permease subunit [Bacillota bacterium]
MTTLRTSPSTRRRNPLRSLQSAPSLLLMSVLILYPLGALLLQIVFPDVFNYHMSWRPSFGAVRDVMGNSLDLTAIGNSFWIGCVAALVSIVVGTVTAFGGVMARGGLRSLISGSVWVIFFAPSYVIASGWVILLQQGGVMQLAFGLPSTDFTWFFSPVGLFLIMGLRYFPFAHFAMTQAIENIGPEYINAARMLGARKSQVFTRVWLRLLTPALLAGATIAFADGFGDFGLAAVITPQMQIPMVSYQIYTSLYETPVDYSSAAVLSLLVTLVTAAALILQFWWLSRRSFTTVSSSSRSSSEWPGRGSRTLIGLTLLLVCFGLVLPLGATLMQSFWKSDLGGLGWNNWTTAAYTSALSLGGAAVQALLRSGAYALVAAAVTAVLGLFVAQQMTFLKSLTSRILNTLTMATIAIPGVVLAAGFVFAWNATWLIPLHLILYETPLCLAMAYVAGHLPYTIRLQLSSLSQISPNLLTAAQTLGAKRRTVIRRIVVPLVRETVVSTVLITFTGVIFELPAATLLYPPGQPPFSVLVQQKFNSFEWSQGSALTMIGMGVVFGSYALGNFLLRRGLGGRQGGMTGAFTGTSSTVGTGAGPGMAMSADVVS